LDAAQMPDPAALPVRPVASAGTDNVLYRLDDTLCLRFPRTPSAADLIAREARWLPVRAPLLSMPITMPLRVGSADLAYPYGWSATQRLPGPDALAAPPGDQAALAQDLANFIRGLWIVDPGLARHDPPAGRGGPLANRDPFIRQMIVQVTDEGNPAEWTAFWNAGLALPRHDGQPRWLHGNLHGTDILLADSRPSAVIDWGCPGLGDPADDVAAVWYLFDPPARAVFRAMLAPDAATCPGDCGLGRNGRDPLLSQLQPRGSCRLRRQRWRACWPIGAAEVPWLCTNPCRDGLTLGMGSGRTGPMGEAGAGTIVPLFGGGAGGGVQAVLPDGSTGIVSLIRGPGGILLVALPSAHGAGGMIGGSRADFGVRLPSRWKQGGPPPQERGRGRCGDQHR